MPALLDMHSRQRRARRGFSLVELVLVMAILAVIAAVAVPRFAHAESSYRARAGAAHLADLIMLTETEARTRSMPVEIRLDQVNNRVRIITSGGATLVDTIVSSGPNGYGIDHVRLEGKAVKITFDGHGTADRSGIITCRSGRSLHAVIIDAPSGVVSTATIVQATEFETATGIDALFPAIN